MNKVLPLTGALEAPFLGQNADILVLVGLKDKERQQISASYSISYNSSPLCLLIPYLRLILSPIFIPLTVLMEEGKAVLAIFWCYFYPHASLFTSYLFFFPCLDLLIIHANHGVIHETIHLCRGTKRILRI